MIMKYEAEQKKICFVIVGLVYGLRLIDVNKMVIEFFCFALFQNEIDNFGTTLNLDLL
jgi:hypothetical protein